MLVEIDDNTYNGFTDEVKAHFKPFTEEERVRMLKFVVAHYLRWSGVRFTRTTLSFQETPTEDHV